MASAYTYTFDGNLAYAYGSGGTFPQTVPISGKFTVQYYDDGTAGSISGDREFKVNGVKLENISINRFTNISGVNTYRILGYTDYSSSQGSNYLYLYYNGQTPSSFVNAEYTGSAVDYSVFPTVNTSATYRSQQLSVTATVAVCFTTNTLISTARGEIAVEDLEIGDFAITASGPLRPITWVGHRTIKAESGALAFHQQPVRVRTGAFGHGLPVRDLLLSPGHPVLVGADADNEGGVLVPVMCLINGTSIAREPRASVTYWHVELDRHDILLAEGLPAESYIDGGDRAFFAEASDHALQNPDFVAPGWNGRCRPVALDGPVVEDERRRLDAVFASALSEQCAWPTDPGYPT